MNPDAKARRRRWLIVLVVVVVVVGSGAYLQLKQPYGISLSHPLGRRNQTPPRSQANDAGTSIATIRRSSLSETTTVNGTLGYAGGYTVFGQGAATVTWLPAPGRAIHQGQVLYRVDGRPVVLLYGSTPAYRSLAAGATAAQVTGADVAQLNHALVALGYVHGDDVNSAWSEFSWATIRGVQKLQKHLGVTQTGRLQLGDVVFLPTAARVTALNATLGGPVTGPVLHATSTTPMVSVDLSADLQSQVQEGNHVTITLPDNSTTPGVVSSVGTVAALPSADPNRQGSSDETPTVTVRIRPTHPGAIGHLDQAPVLVAITANTVHNALSVPVSALLARAGGAYAVEIVAANGTRHLVPVTPGLFDDAQLLVQITGAGLAAGQRVVVAGQ